MRTIQYDIFPAVGSGTTRTTGTVQDLVLMIPGFLSEQVIPPWTIFNEVLRRGRSDAGMKVDASGSHLSSACKSMKKLSLGCPRPPALRIDNLSRPRGSVHTATGPSG